MLSSSDPIPRASALSSIRAALERAIVGQEEAKLGVVLAGIAEVGVWIEGPCGSGKSTLACVARALFGDGSEPEEPRAEGVTGASVLRHARAGAIEHVHISATDLQRSEGDVRRSKLGTFRVATGAPDRSKRPAHRRREVSAFPVRVRMQSLILRPEADALCARAIAAFDRIDAHEPEVLARSRTFAQELRSLARTVELDAALRRRVIDAIARVQASSAAGDRNPVAVLWAAPRLLRAHAVLRGARRVEPVDLDALRFLDGFGTADRNEEPGSIDAALPSEDAIAIPIATQTRASCDETAVLGHGAAGATVMQPPPRIRDLELPSVDVAALQQLHGSDAPPSEALAVLIARLEHRVGRDRARSIADPAGAPRRWRRLRSWDELVDADPVEVWDYIDQCRADEPRVAARARGGRAISIALLRDVSASMQGPVGRWCSRFAVAWVDAAQRRRWRSAYIEFHDGAERHLARGCLFHRQYAALRVLAARPRAQGRTSYQAPLRALLGHPDAMLEQAHVVLVTDGIPVLGDPRITRERAELRARGWRLHTVFVGLGATPAILRETARETGGICARVQPRPNGGFVLAAEDPA